MKCLASGVPVYFSPIKPAKSITELRGRWFTTKYWAFLDKALVAVVASEMELVLLIQLAGVKHKSSDLPGGIAGNRDDGACGRALDQACVLLCRMRVRPTPRVTAMRRLPKNGRSRYRVEATMVASVMVAAEPRYACSPAVAPGEVVPLTSRAERRASRRRSAHSFPAQTYARAPPWHASRYSAPARRHEA